MLARPLPRRVRFKQFETGLSLALRLSHRHGARWKSFAGATGLPVSGLRISEHLAELSACSAVSVDRISPWTPHWFGHNVKVLGHTFDRSRFLRLNLRVCPVCMGEDVAARGDEERAEDAAYLRLDWCLAFIFGCERHNVRLVTRCWKCGARPKWNIGRIDACHCGTSLVHRQPELLTASETSVLALLGDRLHGRKVRTLVPGLSEVPLGDLVNLLWAIGQIIINGHNVSATASSLETENLPEILTLGLSAISDLPRSFERELDALASRGPGPDCNPKDVYGLQMVRWMHVDRPFVEILRPIFDAHAAEHSVVPKRAGADDPPSKFAVDMAKKRQFLTTAEMARLVEAVGWSGPWPARRDEVKASFSYAIMTMKEAAEYLEIPWKVMKRLREAGAIAPCWSSSGYQYYYRAELDALVEEAGRGAPHYKQPPLNFMTVAQLSRRRAIHWHEIILCAIEGRAHCQGVIADKAGLSALLFDPDDFQSNHHRRPEDSLTKSMVCDLLHLNSGAWEAIDGHLLVSKSTGPCMTYVLWTEVEDFDRKYITSARICAATGASYFAVQRAFQVKGISSMISGDGYSIYARKDANASFPALRARKLSGDLADYLDARQRRRMQRQS